MLFKLASTEIPGSLLAIRNPESISLDASGVCFIFDEFMI
jgi:hypothetical protein